VRTLWVLTVVGCGANTGDDPVTAPIPVEPAVLEAVATPVEPAKPRAKSASVFKSFELTRNAVLYKAPGDLEGDRVGSIRGGTRVEVKAIGPVGSGCDRWVEIEPRGWTCESALVPSTAPPSKSRPVSLVDDWKPGTPLVFGVYGSVVRGAIAYGSVDDIRAGSGRAIDQQTTVRGAASVMIDGERFWQTTRGDYIKATSVGYIAPSRFKGEVIDPEYDVLPAWVRRRDDPREPALTTTTDKKRKRKLPYHTVVTILETSIDGTRVRIGDDEWIARRDVRVATRSEPPPGIGAHEKWFDVDTAEQVLVAYEGTQPVYATLVSTGKWGHWTPPVIARINQKYEATTMDSEDAEGYSVADVPWTMFYDGNYALHTAYWHNTFGGARSHGCVNLSPRDAKILYRWSSPDIPPGWTSIVADVDHPGSIVRVRVPGFEPVVRGYARKLLANNKRLVTRAGS
jgi:hypothetical protein